MGVSRPTIFTYSSTLVLIVATTGLNRAVRAQAPTRTLSDACYVPGQPMTVTLRIPGSQDPPEGAALADVAPTGWTITAVSDLRCSSVGTVVNCSFLPLPTESVTITYDVTPPFGETGVHCWDPSSEFSISGVPTLIAVDCVPPLEAGVCDGSDNNCGGAIVDGFDVSNLAVVARLPAPGRVNNRADGVDAISIEFDGPFPDVSIEVIGVNRGLQAGGTLAGNGTTLRSLTFPQPLPDQDRYRVIVRTANCLAARWEFVTLVGDCDENERVNIFDLGIVRAALRSGTFETECDIQEDGRINIFDLAHIRAALRAQASVP